MAWPSQPSPLSLGMETQLARSWAVTFLTDLWLGLPVIRVRTGWGITKGSSVGADMFLIRSRSIGEAWLGGLDLGRSERIAFFRI